MMLTEKEKAAMSGYMNWHYTDMPSGFEIVDFYLSPPGASTLSEGNLLNPTRAMSFIFLGAFPSFTMNFHLYRGEDIPYLQKCLEYIRNSGMDKKIRIFIHIKEHLDRSAVASLGEALVIPLDLWQHHYRQADTTGASLPQNIMIAISIKPDAAGTFHDTLHSLYREGIRAFLTRFDPRPTWSESEFKSLEKHFERCAGFYLDSLGRQDPFAWDELEHGIRHFSRHASFDCRCGERIIALLSNGSIYPCRFLLEKGKRSQTAGNLSRKSLIASREIRRLPRCFVRHPLYCQWECSNLDGGAFAQKLDSYGLMMERICERTLVRLMKAGHPRDVIALPDSTMAPVRPHPHRIAEHGNRGEPAEKDLSYLKQWKEKAPKDRSDVSYNELYLYHIRWQPEAPRRRRSQGRTRQ